MPRRAVASHRRRDKISNHVVPECRGEAQLADFLLEAVNGDAEISSRSDLIHSILFRYAKRHAFQGDGGSPTALGVFLKFAASEQNKTPAAFAEEILTSWARRNGFTARK